MPARRLQRVTGFLRHCVVCRRKGMGVEAAPISLFVLSLPRTGYGGERRALGFRSAGACPPPLDVGWLANLHRRNGFKGLLILPLNVRRARRFVTCGYRGEDVCGRDARTPGEMQTCATGEKTLYLLAHASTREDGLRLKKNNRDAPPPWLNPRPTTARSWLDTPLQ